MSKLTFGRMAAALFSFAIIFPAMAWAQQADSTDADSPVIPPAPLIQKKNPNAISIPVPSGAASKYQQQPAALTNVTVVNAAPASSKPVALASPDQGIDNRVTTNAKLGSSFGYRRDPFTGRAKFHTGCDIKAHWGQPVGASLSGTVQFSGWSHGYGNLIIVEHGGGIATHYAHLSSFAVEPGEHVDRGSIIGYAGSTGRATSPHLHYEVRLDGAAVNPLDPIALDESSDFFKNVAAARIVQSAPGQAAGTDSTRPAEPNQPIPSKVTTTEHTNGNQAKPAYNGAANPAQPAASDAPVSQERPRRITPHE